MNKIKKENKDIKDPKEFKGKQKDNLLHQYILAIFLTYFLHCLLTTPMYEELETLNNNILDDTNQSGYNRYPKALHNNKLFIYEKTNFVYDKFM